MVYILECKDKTLYTGITNDFERRLTQHQNGTGAKYTRGRAPFNVIYKKIFGNRSEASVHEAFIKRMTKKDKLSFVEQNNLE